MTDMTPAARAREAALSVEAKKHALRQQQDGCWIMTLRVHQNDMPEAIMKAAMGTRYQLAMVEIGDDEQPIVRQSKPPITTYTAEQPVSRRQSPAEDRPGPAQRPPVPTPVRADKEKRAFAEMPAPQQAGILCNEIAFQLFLKERHNSVWSAAMSRISEDSSDYGMDAAAEATRLLCKVTSRSALRGSAEWSALILAYRLWQREPEFIGAA